MITEKAIVDDEIREAVFSEDLKYRYRLDITWDSTLPTMTTIALNPSTADHLRNDPTIRKCKKWAKAWGYGTYRMLNAFAIRGTDYKIIFRTPDPIGPENTIDFLRFWSDGTLVIAAWGAHITERMWKHYYRGHDIYQGLENLGLKCLRVTKSGHPEHPLYLPDSSLPLEFAYA